MSVLFGSVLVVNDVEINLIVVSELLESYKLQVDTASSGFLAYDKIKSGCLYDIIFMDNMMPEMDGIETTQKIREHGYKGKIVMLTGNEPEPGADYSMFDGFLLNPIDIKALEDVFDKFIPIIRQSDTVQSKTDKLRLKRAFKRDAEKAITMLKEACCQTNGVSDIRSMTSTFHAMKTALANIGREKESHIAHDLEKAGLEGDTRYVLEQLNLFVEILQEISAAQGADAEDDEQNDENITENMKFLICELKMIQAACREYDIHAVESAFYDLLKNPLKKATRDFLEEIRDLIYSDSDFDGVSEKITDYISSNSVTV
jgi:CheY-like chemotaxis protein